MVNVFIALEVVGICVIFLALVLLIADDGGSREQKLMSYFLCGALVQNVGYFLELTAPSLEAALLAIKVEYLGSIFIPLCYCWFLYDYCYEKPPRVLLNILGVIDFLLIPVVFTQEWHHLYYRNVEWLEAEGGHHYLSLEYGPGYPVFLLCGCIMPYTLSLLALCKAMIRRPEHTASRKYKTILILSLLPILALFSYAIKLTYIFDMTPAVLGIVLSLVVLLIWRRKTYDYKRMAAEVLLNSMGDGVIALDTQERLFSYNQAAAAIFPQLLSHSAGDSIQDIKDFPEHMLDENDNQEFCLNGHFYESHTKPILTKGRHNQGYVVLILDVTDTRNYIEEIKTVREQAEQANRAKSEFLANMSHEIRTPMNAIMGLSDIIMEECKDEKMHSYTQDIKSATRNLLELINDILDLSKVEAGKMELVASDYYVKAIVNEVVHMMDIAASQKGLLLECEFQEDIPCLYHGDQGRIKQMLINLLNNAIKFTKKGYVKVSITGRAGEKEDEEWLVFRVEDTGCGIKEEDQEEIFQNFKQVDTRRNRSTEGTGLGLSITKHLAELMGGKIELESVYGKGSVFTVTIPQKIVDKRTLAQVPDTPVREKERMETFVADSIKVLVVDDNLVNRKVARCFLDTYQFHLEEAASGFEAIDLVKKNRYDIIFMDHMMPEMDGLEAVKIIREECGENGKSPIIIALTANAMEGVKEKFLSSGFQDFVTKPLDRWYLNDVLLKWIPAELRRETTEQDKTQEEEKSEFDTLSIRGIDREAVKEYQAGSLDAYVELLQLYCMDGERKLALLKKLYEEKDYKNYEIEVHGLKSASANIGAMELSAMAKEHEMAAGREDEAFITEGFAELLFQYEEQLQELNRFLQERQEDSSQDSEELPDIDKEALIQEVREALELLEDFHSKECAGKVEKLLGYRLEESTRTGLKEIRNQLKLYEDTLAEELLGKLLDDLT